MHRFENRPHFFRIKWPPGGSPSDDITYWIVRCATGCRWPTWPSEERTSAVNNVPFIECRCYLSEGNGLRGSEHTAYQEACLKVVKGYISLFRELSQSGATYSRTIMGLIRIFLNLTTSSLLEHCCLDMELVLLCRLFFGFVKDFLTGTGFPDHMERGKEKFLKWLSVSRFSGQWD